MQQLRSETTGRIADRVRSENSLGSCVEPGEAWSIGVVVATNWLAHREGPSPDALDVFEAEHLGLIELDQKCVPSRGEEASRVHGWL